MIRKDREVTDFKELLEIVGRCDVCRLVFNDEDGYPYILPLNFGVKVDNETLTLYFHSALKGRKFEIIAHDNRASFEMDCNHDLFSVKERGYCTMNYESVIGRGTVHIVTDEEEKFEALTLLTDRYHGGEHFSFNPAAIPRTTVYKLLVTGMTGKRKCSAKS